ncbi:thioredoxin-like domain-containing protein, partial [Myroides injenensis]|uniref:thioredoxin-like domain-containing protein n=1 Tax=Myroides injenensis TaxID=1183151 RepID=UPI000288BDEC
FNNEDMIQYSSYTKYLSIMLNSISNEAEMDFDPESKFDKNIEKLNIVDTLIKNEKVRNTIFDNITFIYLLEDQNLNNNDKFLERYFQLSTDKSKHSEIIQIQEAVQNLKYSQRLPEVDLVDTNNNPVSINKIIKKPTLMFVWTKNSLGHADGAHRRAIQMLNNNPDIQIVSVCIDGEQNEWVDFVSNYKHQNLIELRSTDFKKMKDKWIITKIQRSMILNSDGTINNAFVNIFDRNIDKQIR